MEFFLILLSVFTFYYAGKSVVRQYKERKITANQTPISNIKEYASCLEDVLPKCENITSVENQLVRKVNNQNQKVDIQSLVQHRSSYEKKTDLSKWDLFFQKSSLQKPEKFSHYSLNPVNKNDYYRVALTFIVRMASKLAFSEAEKIAEHVVEDVFLPKYIFLDEEEFDSWEWPELESIAKEYPEYHPLANHRYWNDIKNTNMGWMRDNAAEPLLDWLLRQPIAKLRVWQKKHNLKPEKTKAALANQIIFIDDVEIIKEWKLHLSCMKQNIDRIEFLKIHPPIEPYPDRLIRITKKHLDFYHTATNTFLINEESENFFKELFAEYRHIFVIDYQCPICKEKNIPENISFLSENDLPPFHPACLCDDITRKTIYS